MLIKEKIMNPEQPAPTESTETTTPSVTLPEDLSEIDPSIDPKKLTVQEGPDMGRINAFDTEQGTALTDSGDKKDLPNSQQPYTVEGLTPVGIAAEEQGRNQGIKDETKWDKIEEANPNATGVEIKEMYHDEVGTDALVESVVKKATETLREHYPEASDETIDNLAKIVGEKFRDNQKEKQSEAEAARQNQAVQEIAKKIQDGVPMSEAAPDLDLGI